ncbi:hypothetical protein [Mesorhizobium qingshengii]|uniref:Uncharacterized protein n=1 Tax=Mesorhizobium qingshengii TaxID=1165689 RepID=A0A1G5Z3G9_9HYPH|nr:hypothetical protein [Mesorhizobium qingshengii]SDA88993.1 hypothetical protein SAMN02927914_04099 [Mesorhizobium qingshengii]
MPHRYATIIIDDDGREIVSAIGEFEGAAPRTRLGRVEQVASGVLIGMVRDAAGGFSFPQAGTGGLAMARLRAGAAKPARVAKPAQAAKPAGTTRPKRARKARKKSARSKKPARSMPKAGISASDAGAMGQADG